MARRRPRPRDAQGARRPARPQGRRRALRPLRRRPGVRHRRPARHAGRRAQSHEPRGRPPHDGWLGALPQSPGARRGPARRGHRPRRPHRLAGVPRGHRRRALRRGDSRARVRGRGAHAAGGPRRGCVERRRGRDGHRQPQPARVQRLQGLLGQRRADHPAARRGHRRRHRPDWPGQGHQAPLEVRGRRALAHPAPRRGRGLLQGPGRAAAPPRDQTRYIDCVHAHARRGQPLRPARAGGCGLRARGVGGRAGRARRPLPHGEVPQPGRAGGHGPGARPGHADGRGDRPGQRPGCGSPGRRGAHREGQVHPAHRQRSGHPARALPAHRGQARSASAWCSPPSSAPASSG